MAYLDKSFGIGSRSGRLVLQSIAYISDRGEKRTFYNCRCDCGGKVVAQRNILKRGGRKSCGCLLSDSHKTHGDAGNKKTRLYYIWVDMRRRCRNSTNPRFKYWGGRHITVSPQWQSFKVFRGWAMRHGYDDKLTIDRIDNNGNYEPSNCRFVTSRVQNRNTRANKYLEAFGEKKCLMDWFQDKRSAVNYSSYRKRLKNGMAQHDALFSPRALCR